MKCVAKVYWRFFLKNSLYWSVITVMRVVTDTFWTELKLSFWLVKSKPQKLFAMLISLPPRPPSHALLFPSLRPSSTQERPWRPFWSMWRPLNPRWSRSQGEPARSSVCVSPSGGGEMPSVWRTQEEDITCLKSLSRVAHHTRLWREKKRTIPGLSRAAG